MTTTALLFLALAWAAGVALTAPLRLRFALEERLALGLPLGFGLAAMVTWLVAAAIGWHGAAVGVASALLAGGTAATLVRPHVRATLRREAGDAGASWHTLDRLPLALVVMPATAYFIPLFARALQVRPDGLYAGHVNIWLDWPTHLNLAGYLAATRTLLPAQNPSFSTTNLAYPFLPDFFSAILQHLGADPRTSLSLVSAMLAVALVVILFGTVQRLTGSRWTAMVSVLLVFLGGGLGFMHLVGDATGHEYTNWREFNIWWVNPVLGYLAPQRGTLFGWPMGLLVLGLAWHSLQARAFREMFAAGILLGMMPLFHATSYVDLLVILGGAALLSPRRWRLWLAVFVPALALGIPQALLILPPAETRFPFLRVQLGWEAATYGQHDNVAWFWLLNTALLIPLALLTMVRSGWTPPGLRRLLLPSWLLFIVPNIWILQPSEFDNTKWFTWWMLPASILAAVAITRLGSRGRVFATVAVVLVVVQVASGGLDLARALQQPADAAALRLADNDELALAAWVRDHTAPDAVLLTGWQPNHPVRMLGQRPQVLGSPVNLYTYGIDPRPRQQEVIEMYSGGATSAALLHLYDVRYVVVGPQEVRDLGADAGYFRARYAVRYRSPQAEYEVFEVASAIPGGVPR